MKKPNRTRTLIAITILSGIAAGVLWNVDLVGIGELKPQLPSGGRDGTQHNSTPPPPVLAIAPGVSKTDETTEPFEEKNALPTAPAPPSEPVPEIEPAEVVDHIPAKSTGIIDAQTVSSPQREVPQQEISTAKPTAPAGLSKKHFDEIALLIDAGRDVEAHKKLSAWYWNYPDERSRILNSLESLAESIFFASQPHYEEPYVIEPGDQLRKIASKYKISWQYLARLNRVDPRKIRFGQKLKVVRGPFDAVVDLSDYELTILCHGLFVRRYQVGIGKDGSSPLGKFSVKDKLEDPVYYGPDGVISNDDPANPLGERWIDIGDSFGIHGTIEPDSIGKSESRGCIRMLNDDVAEVYDFLTVGSTVWIRR